MALEDVLLTDLAFTDDLQTTPQGDFDVLSGTANLKAAILRRILTVPGSLAHRPDYGCGLLSFVNAPLTIAVRRQLVSRIAEQLPRDARVKKVTSVSIAVVDSEPSKMTISLEVEAVGIGATTFKYTPFVGVVV